jgi:hypothetical protein
LRQHQIGGLQDVVALDHALRAGDGHRLDLRAAEAVLGLQIANRPDRGMRGGVACSDSRRYFKWLPVTLT